MNTGYSHRFPFPPARLLPCGGKKNTGKADALQKTRQDVLVQSPNDLTAAWAQRIIDGHTAGAIVSKVDIVSVDIGTTTRVRLFVDHDGPESLSRRWFVKLPSLAWRARWMTALPRLLHSEVRFYREIAESMPINRPPFLAAQSKFGRGATLVLTDVTEFGACPGYTSDALTAAQAASTIEQLAQFHAHFWNKTAPCSGYRWLADVRRLEDLLGMFFAVPLMKRGLRRAGSLVPTCLHAPAFHYARYRRRAMRLLADGASTLVHHDCHPGNLFWHKSRPGFLDWQLVRIGEGIGDVAYFLATALTPETRRLHEASLLSSYVRILGDSGVAGIDPASQLQRYRMHLVYPFEAMLVTLAIGGMMDVESNLELIRRTAAAVEDLNAFDFMPGYS